MARELNATIRNETGRLAVNRLRRQGLLPAVLYREGQLGTNLTVPLPEWQRILAVNERVVILKMEAGTRQALVKEVQYDALGETTLHVDFLELREGQTVRVTLDILCKGIPRGHVDGGVLQQPVHTLHVECLPTAIPEKIILDVTPLGVDEVVHVSDLKLPEGVVALDPADTVIAAVHLPRAEEAAAAAAAEAATEPEVLMQRKEEEAPAAEGAGEKKGEKKEEKKGEKKK